MKPIHLLSVLLVAVGASALTSYLMRSEPTPAVAAGSGAAVRPQPEERSLAPRLDALERDLAALAARPAQAAAAPARYAEDELERAVRRVLEEDAAQAAPTVDGEESVVVEAAAPRLPKDTASLLALLEDPSTGELDRQLLWEQVRAAGRIDEVVASYEAAAKADPNDPEAQLQLGNAYLQKLFAIGDGPLKGMVAMQADSAFDRALGLDPANWEARFTKAVSLSHWPPVFGKQSEAISHFEVLVQQQRNLTPLPEHANTYLLLGNLYQQSGKTEQALATWQEGLETFPGHPALSNAVSSN